MKHPRNQEDKRKKHKPTYSKCLQRYGGPAKPPTVQDSSRSKRAVKIREMLQKEAIARVLFLLFAFLELSRKKKKHIKLYGPCSRCRRWQLRRRRRRRVDRQICDHECQRLGPGSSRRDVLNISSKFLLYFKLQSRAYCVRTHCWCRLGEKGHHRLQREEMQQKQQQQGVICHGYFCGSFVILETDIKIATFRGLFRKSLTWPLVSCMVVCHFACTVWVKQG